MAFRRPSPCKRCRTRHHACYSETADHSGECSACRRCGVICEEQKGGSRAPPRQMNTSAELRLVSLRLGAAIDALQDMTPKGSEVPEIDNLVERLTAVAFTNDGLDRPCRVAEDASQIVTPEKSIKEADMGVGGFVWAPERRTVTLKSLIKSLPCWTFVENLLLSWPLQWVSQIDAFLLPTWPRQIEDLYLNGFSPPPHPHSIALLLAFLAQHEAYRAVMISRKPELRQKLYSHIMEAERYMGLAFDALGIDNTLEDDPTLDAIRTLQMLASTYICCWIDHSRLRKGLALLPVAVSLIHRLGYNRADADFVDETAASEYERKTVVLAVVRTLWVNNPLIARQSAFSPASVLFDPPSQLDTSCLPRDAKYHRWMPAPYTIKSLQIRSHCAIMRHELQAMTHKGKDCDYRQLTAFATRITRRAGELFPIAWQPFEDPNTRDMVLAPLNDSMERVARFLAVPSYENMFLALHRSFLSYTENSSGVDAAWHRKELVLACRKQWSAVSEGREVVGGFLSIWCACKSWDIAICCTLLLSPAHAPHLSASDLRSCSDVVVYCMDRYKNSGFPYVYRNLARLISFIHCRFHPSLGKSPEPEEKRAKRDGLAGGLDTPWYKPPKLDGDRASPLDFTFSVPLHLRQEDFDEDYVHLTPHSSLSIASSPSLSTSTFHGSISRSVSSHSTNDPVLGESKVF